MSLVRRSREARLEPTTEELVEAREREDAGYRTAFPELAERIGLGSQPGPEPTFGGELGHETAAAVGAHLLNAEAEIAKAALKLPLEGQMDLHLSFNSMINELRRVTGELADRWEK